MSVNAELIDSLVEKIAGLIGSDGLSSNLKEDAQRNLRAVVQNAFSNLDMVSRDEFDAQVAVLQRSRAKIDQLEKQLAELSTQID